MLLFCCCILPMKILQSATSTLCVRMEAPATSLPLTVGTSSVSALNASLVTAVTQVG